MQISVETTTQSASIFTASFGNQSQSANQKDDSLQGAAPAVSLLEQAADKAEEDAVVIAALQEAVQKGREEEDEDSKSNKLATVEDYQKTAGKLKSALGVEDGSGPSVSYESGTTTTTTIEATIGDETISAQFVSFERVSYSSDTGLSVRTASASNIEGQFGGFEFSQQSASVSSLYAGTGSQISNLAELTA